MFPLRIHYPQEIENKLANKRRGPSLPNPPPHHQRPGSLNELPLSLPAASRQPAASPANQPAACNQPTSSRQPTASSRQPTASLLAAANQQPASHPAASQPACRHPANSLQPAAFRVVRKSLQTLSIYSSGPCVGFTISDMQARLNYCTMYVWGGTAGFRWEHAATDE